MTKAVTPPCRSDRTLELDIVRVLTFACVIAVHVIGNTAEGDPTVVGSLILLHFTREVFFALSGWVLTASYLARPRPMRDFWPRRFLLVGVPYVTWTLVYAALKWVDHRVPAPQALGDLLWYLVSGTAWYHLYFLLVTMQIYLLFPLLVRLIVSTRRHWKALLAISFALQLLKSALDTYDPGVLSPLNVVSTVLNYQAFVIGGAVAADHADPLLRWVRSRRRRIAAATALLAAASIAVYLLQLHLKFSPYRAAGAYQPMVLIWSVAAGLSLLALGTWWVDRSPSSRQRRALAYLSDRSFGVFLAHPLIIWILLATLGGATASWPRAVVAAAFYPVVALAALGVSDAARRSPLSLPLAGRPWRPGARTVARTAR